MAIAGYLGGRVDAAMMRFVDIVFALPYIFIVIILSTLFPRGSIAALFIAIGAVGWLTMARIVRGTDPEPAAPRIRRRGDREWRDDAGDPVAPHRAECRGTRDCYATLNIPS
jgi:hypothetical protein